MDSKKKMKKRKELDTSQETDFTDADVKRIKLESKSNGINSNEFNLLDRLHGPNSLTIFRDLDQMMQVKNTVFSLMTVLSSPTIDGYVLVLPLARPIASFGISENIEVPKM
jgi:hypothetical protein